MYGDRLETTVNAKVEVDAQVAVTAAATADDNIVLLRWGQILANGYLEKEIDRQVAAGKLIGLIRPLSTASAAACRPPRTPLAPLSSTLWQSRPSQSQPSHSPTATEFDQKWNYARS